MVIQQHMLLCYGSAPDFAWMVDRHNAPTCHPCTTFLEGQTRPLLAPQLWDGAYTHSAAIIEHADILHQ